MVRLQQVPGAGPPVAGQTRNPWRATSRGCFPPLAAAETVQSEEPEIWLGAMADSTDPYSSDRK
jgi:hypothetical protein